MLKATRRKQPGRPLSGVAAAILLFAVSAGAIYAGQPVVWETSGRADLLKGDSRGVSISDTGMLMLAPRLTEVFNTEQAFVWASTVDSQGNEYFRSSHHGRTLKLSADVRG